MMTIRLCVLLFAAVATASVYASDDSILIPIRTGHIRGANGAEWTATLTVSNTAPHEIHMEADSPPVAFPIPAGSTVENPVSAGALRWRLTAPGLHFRLHLVSLSPGASSIGVDVPVVRESQFSNDAAYFAGIKLGEHVRTRLRAYALLEDRRDTGELTVVVLDSAQAPIAVETLPFQGNGLTTIWPIEISIEEMLSASEGEVVNLMVTSSRQRTWSIVSQTANDTNDVTLIFAQ